MMPIGTIGRIWRIAAFAVIPEIPPVYTVEMKQANTTRKISGGVVHELPQDLEKILADDSSALELWEDITPLARNEWICWVEDAKKLETRRRRIERVRNDLKDGKHRPCCWPGCPHRERNGK